MDPTSEADYRFVPFLDSEFGFFLHIQFRSWIWLHRPVVLSFIFVKTEITQGQTDVLLLKYFVYVSLAMREKTQKNLSSEKIIASPWHLKDSQKFTYILRVRI